MPGCRIGGQPVRLRITRLQAHPEGPTRHPVIYIPGGPGDAAGQDVSALQAWRRFQQAAAWPLDLVIVDPRGTGLSTPRPFCPTVRGSAGTSRLAECFHRLGRGTAERLGARAQVADLHQLIATLGQGGAVLWAESYGALIARRLAAQHPATCACWFWIRRCCTRSRRGRDKPRPRNGAAASFCAPASRELSCRLAVPSLRATIDALRVWLQKHPATIAIAQPPLSARFVKIDGQMLRTLLLLSAYGHPDDMRVIRLLRRAAAQPAVLAALTGPLMALDRRSPRTAPVYWSTRCQFAQDPGGFGHPGREGSRATSGRSPGCPRAACCRRADTGGGGYPGRTHAGCGGGPRDVERIQAGNSSRSAARGTARSGVIVARRGWPLASSRTGAHGWVMLPARAGRMRCDKPATGQMNDGRMTASGCPAKLSLRYCRQLDGHRPHGDLPTSLRKLPNYSRPPWSTGVTPTRFFGKARQMYVDRF